MNLHLTILAQAAFLEKPRSRKELYNAVGLTEKFSILKERQRTQPGVSTPSGGESHRPETSRNVPARSHTPKCWNCGRPGYTRRHCRWKATPSGNGQAPRRSPDSRARILSAFRKIAAVTPGNLLWVMLDLKVGKMPALVDTCAQFSCVRSHVIEYL